MAPIFTGFRFGFGGGAAGPAGPPANFDTLVATETFTSPFTSSSRDYRALEFIVVGAGGMSDNGAFDTGGQGGFSIGRFVIPTTTALYYAVGQKGSQGSPGPGAGGIGWDPTILTGGSGNPAPYDGQYGGGGGGGASGVFVGTLDQAGALVIAGGGGGTRHAGGIGGNGGGLTADAAPTPGSSVGGGGGTQLAGGDGGANQPGTDYSSPGTALNGGNNGAFTLSYAYGGGGGGAGYYGGGGGGGSTTTSGTNSAGGGGGSGHLKSSSPYYVPYPTIERVYTGMGLPGPNGTGPNPAPLGAGYTHPAISPYYPGGSVGNSSYGAPGRPDAATGPGRGSGLLIVRYYQ